MTLEIVRDNPHPYPSKEYDLFFKDLIIDNIRLWKDRYYNADGSAVDDQIYDLWWKNLLFLESKYPDTVADDSPTHNPGAPVAKDKK